VRKTRKTSINAGNAGYRRNRDVTVVAFLRSVPTAGIASPPRMERTGRDMGQRDTRRSQRHDTAPNAARIECIGLTKRFLTPKGQPFTAIHDVTLTVEPGEFCAIVGPTGCGKSTTLGQVSGLERPSAGSVRVGGHDVRGITDGVSFMFQSDALFPWKTVLGNVMVGPTLGGTSRKAAIALARDWLRRVGLAGFEDRYPHQLSGGMRKRVAMAAALINEPTILLMDEPFGALDVQTKAIMQTELLGLWEQQRPSVLFITHDLDEAVALADRVLIMTSSPGSIKHSFDIDLPRPRGEVQEIRHTPRFLELQHQIWTALKEEVQRAYAQTADAA
jgi:NitT/TauT family transport system ATP-binding protein